jgi:hypothetical protein
MKSINIFLLTLLAIFIFSNSAFSQKSLGLGLTVGENMNIAVVPVPVFGIYGIAKVASSIDAGLQLGFMTGTSSGDSKIFDNVTGLMISPFVRINISDISGLKPYFKINLAYLNYNYSIDKTDDKESSSYDDSNTAIWGTFGLKYDLAKNLNLLGQVRFLDLGLSGKTKISMFGISYPSIGLEFYFK